MPRTVKKTATRRAHRAKSKGISKAQKDSLKVDLSLVMRMEEWARCQGSSLGDALDKAMSDFLERNKQADKRASKKMTPEEIGAYFDNLPETDEELTDEERASEEEGWKECQQGLGRPWAEVRKELAGGQG